MHSNHDLLEITLQLAVPMWIEQLCVLSPQERLQRLHESRFPDTMARKAKGEPDPPMLSVVDVVASQADNALYQGPRKGDTARAFNAIAESIALLAFAPGGVTFAGMHWEVDC